MAKTALSITVTNSPGYTVPASKHFVFSFGGIIGATQGIRIDGHSISPTTNGETSVVGPCVATAGQVITAINGGVDMRLMGFLYDN